MKEIITDKKRRMGDSWNTVEPLVALGKEH